MKAKSPLKFASLGLALFLAMSLYNCKPKETPFEVPDFNSGYKDVKLPDLTQTQPAAVTSTPGSITASTTATAASTGLASGTVTAAVTSTATDIEKVVTPTEAGNLAAAFTPAVVNTMLSGGAIPTDLSAQMKVIAADPALAAYLPKVTNPSVNGVVVSGFIKETVLPGKDADLPLITMPDFDVTDVTATPCTEAAANAFAAAKKILDDTKSTQEKTVNDAYASRVAGANSATCKSSATTALTAAATAAKTKLDQQLAGLNTLLTNKTISQNTYNLLSFFVYFDLYNSVVAATGFYAATIKACDVTADATIAAAKAAQTADLAKIQTAYTTSLTGIQTKLNADMKTCHDQGQG
ncbi:hypothetical protein [Emticicia agri]|uniref:Uncharacterized protein n=1 Tax=Emticicia agri TaxID=2492393 RepID=A0A4Q5LW68_9BACT|nr:hypothetical protein [Emticicia agri]RYU93733.1 hypothetical protein EWM59_20660 [Emticicia agri]